MGRFRVVLTLAMGMVVTAALPPAALAAGPGPGREQQHGYVTDTMRIGRTAGETQSYAFNLDDDNVLDNRLGTALAGLSSFADFDAAIASSIRSGQVIMLQSLRSRSLTSDPSAWWQSSFAVPTASPVLTGGGTFAIDPAAPSSTTLAGAIADGRFTGGPGAAPVRLGVLAGQPPVELHLTGARIQAACSVGGCTGKLGGGVPSTEVDRLVIPVLAATLQALVDASCTGSTPDSCDARARTILALFDANHDLEITADELRGNNIIRSIFSPDVDLLKANGQPGRDGVKESLSLGLGFTAREARFDAPPGASANHPVTGEPAPRPARAFAAHLQEARNQLCGFDVPCISGAGHVTGMGNVGELANDVVDSFDDWPVSFGIDVDGGTLSSKASGDQLIVSYHVTLTDAASPPQGANYTLAGDFVIDGGTGGLLNASGSGTITGTCTSSFTSPVVNCTTDWNGTITG